MRPRVRAGTGSAFLQRRGNYALAWKCELQTL